MLKLAAVLSKYLPLWVALDMAAAMGVGYLFPGVGVIKALIPFFLFVMLYPMMITLKLEDVAQAVKKPKLILLALGFNFLLTPLMGALWARLFFSGADGLLAAGFILKTLVPGSGMVAAWTGYARGRVESALVIVAVCMLASIVMVPLWMVLLTGAYVDIDPLVIFRSMLLIIVAPMAAGLVTRRLLVRRVGLAGFRAISPAFPAFSTLGMLPMIFVIFSSQAHMLLANLAWMAWIILAIATLYPLLFMGVMCVSRLLKIEYADAIALGYSVTAKAHAITIGLAATAFGGAMAVLPASVAPIIQVPIMLFIMSLAGRIERLMKR